MSGVHHKSGRAQISERKCYAEREVGDANRVCELLKFEIVPFFFFHPEKSADRLFSSDKR